eukprot:TRINITY_DN1055_c0_g1_i1.p1 TRINITY_DN1055_c0_g1~~TRINITY_DN1055_c0_g1_i1.p1  ORF type:complete len:136 (-),score=15.18 TRINITY_DN1055_c0_g1_i1:43-450(-)
MAESCTFCGKNVYLMERTIVGKQVFHPLCVGKWKKQQVQDPNPPAPPASIRNNPGTNPPSSPSTVRSASPTRVFKVETNSEHGNIQTIPDLPVEDMSRAVVSNEPDSYCSFCGFKREALEIVFCQECGEKFDNYY